MGLFSGKKSTIPATGFYAQPEAYQDLYGNVLSGVNDALYPGGEANVDAFTPLAQTEYETSALDAIARGITPNAEQLQSDITMQMNPYDQFVIDNINREAGGQYSILKQGLNEAGQFGSNRQMLGANDIDQQRLNQIGRFKQGQYNQALNNSLGILSAGRRNDAAAQMGAGGFLRGLDTQEKQAPLQASLAGMSALNAIPTEFGNFGTKERTVKTGGGFGSFLGAIAPIVGSAFGPLGAIAGGALGGALSGGGIEGTLKGGIGGALSGGLGNAAGFGLSTGGQGFFSGGAQNMFNASRGAYGPGF